MSEQPVGIPEELQDIQEQPLGEQLARYQRLLDSLSARLAAEED